ncbi:hypothetical protein [Bacillus paralicheniformis]|uniref:hypothetical protein n=1 Tax=Bacillus paralicheniformis TaxID=1648923 RepID=UPI001FD68B8E|nr:hypothetical protein [Bacillus paralicheniformis]MCJ8223660.1 hypothetical protein [Bacillus paralicheniformis]
MKRVNKTINNLKEVEHQLDIASGALYNAFDYLYRMVNLGEKGDNLHSIRQMADRIDITEIDSLREKIIEMIEKKENNKS